MILRSYRFPFENTSEIALELRSKERLAGGVQNYGSIQCPPSTKKQKNTEQKGYYCVQNKERSADSIGR